MNLSTGEKIKIILSRQGKTIKELAEATGQSRQNLSNKMSRDNFTEKEIRVIAEALGCKYESSFTILETGETI